jgi:hypothetical protein
MLVELMMSSALMVLLMLCAARVSISAARFNRFQHARQRCLAAAEAQLDSVATRRESISPAEIQRLWPGVAVTVSGEPGQGDWTGLTMMTVSASTATGDRTVTVELRRCVATEGGRP